QQVARVFQACLLVTRDEVRDAGLRRVRRRAAELLERHLLPRHRLHHVRAGDEHVRRSLDHEDEVCDRRRVDGAARARAHHERDLRDPPGALHVAPEDLRVAGERDDTFLDPRPAGVVDADQRAPVLEREVHHLADLLGEDLAQRPAEHSEVLREDEDLSPEDRAVAGDDSVAVRPALEHPEVRFAVPDIAIELDERAWVEQLDDPLPGEQLARSPLSPDRLVSRGVLRLVAQSLELVELGLGGVGAVVRCRHGRSLVWLWVDEFRLLGPLEAEVDGKPALLAAAKPRALLALLLLERNRVVSTERLIDELWGEEPPAQATKTLQVYVSQLRKALGPDRLVTRPPGYLFRIDDDELDLDRFERLTAEARSLPPTEARDRLGQALALWRGPPGRAAARLDGRRGAAYQDWLQASFESGHAGVPQLEELVQREPLRERPPAPLMLA